MYQGTTSVVPPVTAEIRTITAEIKGFSPRCPCEIREAIRNSSQGPITIGL
jgi:hypothetical protein